MTARLERVACAWACLIVLSACAREPQPPMRVGTDVWAGNEVLAVAEHAGFLDTAKVRRVEFSSNQEVLRALRNGIIESATLMLDEAMVAKQDGVDLVILAAVDSSVGGDAVLGHAPMHSLADLKGRRIGVQLNSGSLQVLRRALSSAKLTTEDVIVVNVPPERHVSWFATGQIDAVATYDPMRMQLVQRGAVDLFNSSAIAGDVVNLLVVHRAYLESHPDQSRALVAAWWKGRDEITRSAAARAWAASRAGLSPEALDKALTTIDMFDADRSGRMVDGPDATLLAMARRFHGFMRENGRLSRDIAVEELFQLPPGFAR